MKHLVLLGAGPAHQQVLRELATQPLPAAQVTLVAPSLRPMAPEHLPAWVAGRRSLDDSLTPLLPLAQPAKVRLVEAVVTNLDAHARRLTLADGQTLDYDTLSLDPEPSMDRDVISGARDQALFMQPTAQFAQLWEALLALAQQRTLSVVVIGSGVRAVELALAVQRRLGKRARIALVTHGAEPLPGFPSSAQARMHRILKRRSVTLFEERCIAIGGRQVMVGDGMRLVCDAPLLALESAAPEWLAGSGLELGADQAPVSGPTLQSTSHPDVFIAGEDQATLSTNLRRFVAGGALVTARPVRRTLKWVDCGEGDALVSWGPWSLEGRAVAWLLGRQRRVGPPAPGTDAAAAPAPSTLPVASEVDRPEHQEHR